MPQAQQVPPAPAKPKPPEPPQEFQEGKIAAMSPDGLVHILADHKSSDFQKAKACQRAGELGAREAIPALSALLSSDHLSAYARYGLEPIADPAVDDVLREALSKLNGDLLVGVINSIGKRRDAKAVPALSKLLYGPSADTARAAAAAMGQVGDTQCARELRAALGKTSGMVRMAVADAALMCAGRLLETGDRNQSLEFYTFLSAPDVPKPVRLAAMNGIIREETSPNRPR